MNENDELGTGPDPKFYYRTFSVGQVDPLGAFDIENYFNNTITHIGYKNGMVGIKISELDHRQMLNFDRNILY